MSLKKKVQSNPLSCEGGGKVYKDITLSEQGRGDYHCGECGSRFLLPEGKQAQTGSATVPEHMIPPDVRKFRSTLRRSRND